MPLAVYLALETDPDAAIALSAWCCSLVSVVVLVALRDRVAPRRPRRVSRPQTLGRRDPAPPSELGGAFTLDVELCASRPARCSAVLGPNGAGKTTLLRALAGLTPVSTTGRSLLDGEVARRRRATARLRADRAAAGSASSSRTTGSSRTCRVRDNVAFAPRARGASRPTPARAAERLARAARPDRARRAQAAASSPAARRSGSRWPGRWPADPALLLLDEPLAALDAETRLDVRAELRDHLADFAGPTLLVTHDPLEAMVLADRLLVIEDGRIVQEGAPAEVARRPATQYVARLVGLNLYPAASARRAGRPSTAAARSSCPTTADRTRPGGAAARPRSCQPAPPRRPSSATCGPGRSSAWRCSPTGSGSRSRAGRPRSSTSRRPRSPSSASGRATGVAVGQGHRARGVRPDGRAGSRRRPFDGLTQGPCSSSVWEPGRVSVRRGGRRCVVGSRTRARRCCSTTSSTNPPTRSSCRACTAGSGRSRPTATGSASGGTTSTRRRPGCSAASSRRGATGTCASCRCTCGPAPSSRTSGRPVARQCSRPTATRSGTTGGCSCTTGSSRGSAGSSVTCSWPSTRSSSRRSRAPPTPRRSSTSR